MQPFSYSKPTTQNDAIAAMQLEPAAAVIAGGTDLLDLMKLGVTAPSQLIDVNGLPLGGVEVTEHGITIGALARLSDVAQDVRIVRSFPVLSQALLASASARKIAFTLTILFRTEGAAKRPRLRLAGSAPRQPLNAGS